MVLVCIMVPSVCVLTTCVDYSMSPAPCEVDGMSEVSSLHDSSQPRSHGHSRPPHLNTLYDDVDEGMSTISSVSQQYRPRRHDDYPRNQGARGRARSMDNLDMVHQHSRGDDHPPNYRDLARGGRRG